jgi:cobalt/nickel transport system permease protein
LAHIHLPDGAFTIEWVAVWWAILLLVLITVLFRMRRKDTSNLSGIAITAMITAVSFATFQISLPLLGGVHLNLTPLVGILLGPGLGILSVFIVNVFSSAIGHGGWGLVGANSLINSVEVSLSYLTFRLLNGRFGTFSSGVGAALVGLLAGSIAMIVVIVVSGIQGSALTRSEIFSNLILLAGVNLFVAAIEGTVTGFALAYVKRLRPDLLSN